MPGLTFAVGEPVGAGVAGAGVVVATGAGVADGLLGVSVLDSHAPKTAVETAKTVERTIDLLIVFLLEPEYAGLCYSRTRGRPLADNAAG